MGISNTAVGDRCPFQSPQPSSQAKLPTAPYNTAVGFQALYGDTTGIMNTAVGANALLANTTGSVNTAVGFHALGDNTIGNFNIALGFNAGFVLTGDYNIAIGNGRRSW